jgi:hypothetical protein
MGNMNSPWNHRGGFLKKVLIFPGLYGGLYSSMGRISHTNLKNRMVISRIAITKNHIELLVPGQI